MQTDHGNILLPSETAVVQCRGLALKVKKKTILEAVSVGDKPLPAYRKAVGGTRQRANYNKRGISGACST